MKALFWIYRTISNKLRRFRKTISLPSCPFELFCHQLRNCFSVARSSVIPWLGKQHDLGWTTTPGIFEEFQWLFRWGGMNFLFEFSSTEKKKCRKITSHHQVKWIDSTLRFANSKKKKLGTPPKQKFTRLEICWCWEQTHGYEVLFWKIGNTVYFINLNWRCLKLILYNFNTSLESKTLPQFKLGLKSYVMPKRMACISIDTGCCPTVSPDVPRPSVSWRFLWHQNLQTIESLWMN